VPEYWTAARIATRVHQAVFKPAGLTRRGRQCRRTDGGLDRTVAFYTSTGGSSPRVEMVVRVAVSGLPDSVTGHRYDSLGGTVRTPAGRHFYPLPTREQDLPPDLLAAAVLADVELVEFLVARVENEEADEHRFDDFLAEIRQFQPGLRHRHPIVRPVRW
jgi:hypothetical protein